MENPFIFDKIVTGEHFCNRKKEIEWIKQRFGKSNILLISPRRFGKTSLILHTVQQYHLPALYVDIAGIEKKEEFVERLLNAYARREKNFFGRLEELLRGISLKIRLTYAPFSVEVQEAENKSLEEIIRRLCREHVIVFDEFQAITTLGEGFVWEIRNIVQRIGHYVFLGSKKSTLLNLFSSPHAAFYKMAEVLHLDKIPLEEWREFIQRWFARGGLSISDEEIEQIYRLAQGIPFYVQYICHHVWEGKKLGKTLNTIIKEILESNAYVYEHLFLSLPKSQRAALKLLVNETRPFAYETYTKYGFKTPQQVQKAFVGLEKKELIEKNGQYRLLDPLFGEWIKLYQKV